MTGANDGDDIDVFHATQAATGGGVVVSGGGGTDPHPVRTPLNTSGHRGHHSTDDDYEDYPEDGDQRMTTGAGADDQHVVMARQVIPDGMVRKDDKDGMYVGAVRCPTAVIGLVAGRDQRNLKEIVSKYQGLKIEIARRRPAGTEPSQPPKEKESFIDWLEGSRCSNINVIGADMDKVDAGLKAVTERVVVAKKRAPFTHCICLPFLEADNPELVSKIESLKKKVLSTTSLENEGIDPSVMVSSKQLHFTLLMLMIYDEETLAKVVTTISNFVEARKTKPIQFPLRLKFTGIHIFDTDKPTRASVVYTHAGTPGVHTAVTDAPEVTTATSSSTSAPGPATGGAPLGGGTSSASGSPTAAAAGQMVVDKRLDSNMCTYTARALTTATERVNTVLGSGVIIPDEIKCQLEGVIKSLGEAANSLREFAKSAPKTPREGTRRPRDISTVSGAKVDEIFDMFSDLVAKLSEAGVLTEEDRLERRIVYNPDGTLAKTSLTLHVTLMSAKWRSQTATRLLQAHRQNSQQRASGQTTADVVAPVTTPAGGQLANQQQQQQQQGATPVAAAGQPGGSSSRQRGFRRGRTYRAQPLTMNVSSLLDDKFDFGEAVITQMHLSRRANTGAEMLTVERVFDLCN